LSKYSAPAIKPEEEEFIVKSPFLDVDIPEINLSDYVWKDVEKFTDRLALVLTFKARNELQGSQYLFTKLDKFNYITF